MIRPRHAISRLDPVTSRSVRIAPYRDSILQSGVKIRPRRAAYRVSKLLRVATSKTNVLFQKGTVSGHVGVRSGPCTPASAAAPPATAPTAAAAPVTAATTPSATAPAASSMLGSCSAPRFAIQARHARESWPSVARRSDAIYPDARHAAEKTFGPMRSIRIGATPEETHDRDI